MKSPAFHVIKSVRIAKARMGKAVLGAEVPAAFLKKAKRPYKRRAPFVQRRNFFEKKESSHSTEYSTSRKRRATRSPEPLSPQRLPSSQEVTDGIGPGECVGSTVVPSEAEVTALKRVKPPRLLRLVEDGLPFTNDEVEAFEALFGDKLFDNTIDTGPATQADLHLLASRKFRSYRTEAAQWPPSPLQPDATVLFEEARRWLQFHCIGTMTNSQLLRLRHFFPNPKSFVDFLRLEPEVLISFLEKSKPASRRRLIR